MATITGISRVKKGEARKQVGSSQLARVTVEVDHEPFVTCSDSIIAEFLLYRGKEVNDTDMRSIEERVVENDAMAYCHATIARRALTEHELADKLRARELSDAIVEITVQRCREIGLVDDEHYAKSFVRSRLRRGHGGHRIRNDLSRRGIDPKMIDAVLVSDTDKDQLVENAREALRKKFRDGDFSDAAVRAKAQRFLLGRGFSYDQIGAAMREIGR